MSRPVPLGRGGRLTRGIIKHLGDELVTAASEGTNDGLSDATVSDRAPHVAHAPGQCCVGDKPVTPDLVQQFVFRHDPRPVVDQVAEQIEHPRFDVHQLTVAAKFKTGPVEPATREDDDGRVAHPSAQSVTAFGVEQMHMLNRRANRDHLADGDRQGAGAGQHLTRLAIDTAPQV